MTYFPRNKELETATLEALRIEHGTATTKIINQRVAEMLELTPDILSIEDETGCGTKYQVRMRWIRTILKAKGLIENTSKAVWSLKE